MVNTKRQLYYEDVQEGMAVPSLVKRPTHVQLFLFSAVKHNPHRIHYDQAYARCEGHPDVLVTGTIHGAFLTQMLTDWIGDNGFLKKLSYSNRGKAVPGDVLTCEGRVTKRYESEGRCYVECEIWEHNQRDEPLCRGSALVVLPKRAPA